MKPSRQIYWKQAQNGLLAHIYEHVMCLAADAFMQKQNNMSVLDYDLWAHTYGKTAFLEVRTQTQEAKVALREILNNTQHLVITNNIINQAILECSCEYERLVKNVSPDFFNDICQLHDLKWQTIADFSAQQADEKTSVDTVFATNNLEYGKRSPRNFNDVFIEYSVQESIYQDSPAMKALAILCVQVLALNLNLQLKSHCVYYDTGDEWAEGAQEVGYRMKLRFPKSKQLEVHELGSILKKGLVDMRKNDRFSQKLIGMLKKNYHNPDLYYFDQYMMNRISDGIVIGGKGWKSVAKEQCVRDILQSIDIEVYDTN